MFSYRKRSSGFLNTLVPFHTRIYQLIDQFSFLDVSHLIDKSKKEENLIVYSKKCCQFYSLNILPERKDHFPSSKHITRRPSHAT